MSSNFRRLPLCQQVSLANHIREGEGREYIGTCMMMLPGKRMKVWRYKNRKREGADCTRERVRAGANRCKGSTRRRREEDAEKAVSEGKGDYRE
jgi:hypothetical protein